MKKTKFILYIYALTREELGMKDRITSRKFTTMHAHHHVMARKICDIYFTHHRY
jgi:hypothetical protein